jgi:hypothetical protein
MDPPWQQKRPSARLPQRPGCGASKSFDGRRLDHAATGAKLTKVNSGQGNLGEAANSSSPELVWAMTTELFLNFLGIRMDSRKAEGMRFTINLITTDNGERFIVELENATLTNIGGPREGLGPHPNDRSLRAGADHDRREDVGSPDCRRHREGSRRRPGAGEARLDRG